MPKKKTTEQFIAEARAVHGAKYDYSKTEYISSQHKVCIICPNHGEFWQKANGHLRGQGCPSCSGTKRRTREEFIQQAKAIHGDKYIYDKVVYVNDSTKVTIVCPKHGDFQITPDRLIHSKQGCKQCGLERRGEQSRMSQQEFIQRATAIHAGKYTYGKVKYIESHSKVIITCPIHGDFTQRAYQHLNGHGCPKCGREAANEKERVSTEEFITRAKASHTIAYDYSHVVMTGMHDPVYIICPEHGGFWQEPVSHLQGCDCPQCAYKEISRKKTKSQEQFIEDARKVHGDRYDYSETVYVNALKKVAIRCKRHDRIFWQKPNAHLNGNGCPICQQSHLENDVMRLLRFHSIEFEVEKTFDWLVYKGPLFLDFFLPEYSIAIECQGEQHFSASDYYGGAEAFALTKKRDRQKERLCEKHGIKMLYFSNLGIDYPYTVIEGLDSLLMAIQNRGKVNNSNLWKTPELPFTFD